MSSRGTDDFWRLYHALPPEIKQAGRAAYARFHENPSHPGLRLERLAADPRAWSVRVTRDFRAVARRYDDGTWLWFWIGSHREFDRRFPR